MYLCNFRGVLFRQQEFRFFLCGGIFGNIVCPFRITVPQFPEFPERKAYVPPQLPDTQIHQPHNGEKEQADDDDLCSGCADDPQERIGEERADRSAAGESVFRACHKQIFEAAEKALFADVAHEYDLEKTAHQHGQPQTQQQPFGEVHAGLAFGKVGSRHEQDRHQQNGKAENAADNAVHEIPAGVAMDECQQKK